MRTVLKPAFLAMALSAVAGSAALGAFVHDVLQRGRSFNMAQITIGRGESLVFENNDEFLHQIYVSSPALQFESDEQAPGQNVTVTFPASGTFEVHCHIHPKMGLVVNVE
jgi:plastocyanin